MKESVLVKRMGEYALAYVRADWDDPSMQYVSAGYLLVALLKLADPAFQETDESFDEEDLRILRERLAGNKVCTVSRLELRDRLRSCEPPSEKDEIYRRHIVSAAVAKARRQKRIEVTVNCFLDAIIEKPEGAVEAVLSEEIKNRPVFDKNRIKKLFFFSDTKQRLRKQLQEQIFGQEEALSAFVDGVMTSMMFTSDTANHRPRGIFVFAGPPGVGKTYLAETGADALKLPVKRYDMSEYSTRGASVELIGSDSVWKDAHEGSLTTFVEACNKEGKACFLIFDEVEKAHLEVIYLFLQILDAGRLTDSYSKRTVSFQNTYIVFTTNAGRSLYEDGKQPVRGISKSVVIEALKNDVNPATEAPYFPESICSRLSTGYIVMFHHLSVFDLVKIAAREMKRYAALFQQNFGPAVEFDDEIPFLLLLNMGGESDARSFRAESEKFMRNRLFDLGSVVGEKTMLRSLRNSNRIRISVHRDSRVDLKRILDGRDKDDAIMLVSTQAEKLYGYEELLTENSDSYEIIPFLDYQPAFDALKTGAVSPAILLVEFPAADAPDDASVYYADKSPLVAGFYAPFLEFLKEAAAELPELPIYVMLDVDYYDDTNTASDLMNTEAAGIINTNRDGGELADEIFGLIERQKLGAVAFRFAREKKGLSFAASPNEEDGELVIRLKNFKVTTLISGSDSESMVTEDRMPSVTFDDYIGGEDVKREVREFIGFLKNPRKFRKVSSEQPKGILLYGPPGTGKTFFAKALAHEAGVPFFPANGSEFDGQYTGSGPKAIRELFKKARKYAPSIIFIDEIDAIAKKRTGDGKSSEETLNMLLTEMDGFEANRDRPVFLVAATNYGIDQKSGMAIDPALVRRFTRAIFVDLPVMEDRKLFIEKSLEKLPNAADSAVIESIAKRSAGMNYGNLNNVIELAGRYAREGKTKITGDLLDNALETILFGERKKWNPKTLERTAWHEAGHAYLNWKTGETPEYVTIMPRGSYGGYVMAAQTEDKMAYTKEELIARVKVCLAGRAGEILRYGREEGLSTGPSGDFKQAGQLVCAYICSYGMDDRLGIIYVPDVSQPPPYVQNRINELLNELLESVTAELEQDKEAVSRLAKELIRKNKLNSFEVEEVLKG